jgi:hypothetical protein
MIVSLEEGKDCMLETSIAWVQQVRSDLEHHVRLSFALKPGVAAVEEEVDSVTQSSWVWRNSAVEREVLGVACSHRLGMQVRWPPQLPQMSCGNVHLDFVAGHLH